MSVISDTIEGNTSGDAIVDAITNEVEGNIVFNKPQEVKSNHNPLDDLTALNDMLEQIPETWLKFFDDLNKLAEGSSQEYVDIWCRRIAWRINIFVERQRQKVIKALYEKNVFARAIIDVLSFGKKVITDPIGTVGGFFSILVSPIAIAYEVITRLMVEIPRLAKNIANIADALPPEPINPNINFDEFTSNLRLGKIDLDSIAAPQDLPPPEVIFPEPPKAWGKAAFGAAYNAGRKYSFDKDKTSEIKYSPNVKFADNKILQEQLNLEKTLEEAAIDYVKSKI